MKKKSLMLLFIVASLLICIIPSAGMILFKSDEAVGNEQQVEFPSFTTEDGKFNENVFEEMGTYFEKHFAFRPYVISVDAEIQSNVFKVSNLESVVVGKDDYLFYSSTLDNYLGRNIMSDRAIDNISHNLKITQSYVQAQGANFLFTVAPNKNSLYEENMPYYYKVKVSDKKNIDNLKKSMEEYGINYCDLYPVFKNNDEVLYLKQDSHWNDKGAMLAYDTILKKLNKPHPDFDADNATTADFMGDLGKMIYPKTQKAEANFDYSDSFDFEYTNEVKSVEDPIIKTECKNASGNLYMYRDSFGNSILPFFASSYKEAYFTKTFPLNLSLDMLANKPDTVVIELVERNLNWLNTMPAVIPSSQLTSYSITDKMDTALDVNAEISMVNMSLIEVSGELPKEVQTDGCDIYVQLTDKSGLKHLYEAYHTCTDNSDYGYLAYIPAENYSVGDSSEVEISVVTKTDSNFTVVGTSMVTVKEAQI